MASSAATMGLLLVVVVVGAAAAAGDDGTTTHLSLFMHDTVSGSNPTAVQVIKGQGAVSATLGMSFGTTMVMDDPLTESSSATSAGVGRMQGTYALASLTGGGLMVCGNLVLSSGDYNGSTIAVFGRDDTTEAVRELAVVGGTGRFRMASGYVLWKTSSFNAPDAVVQLDVYVTTAGGNATSVDASAPVSGGGASGSKSTSGGVAVTMGRVNAFVIAAVVGFCVVVW